MEAIKRGKLIFNEVGPYYAKTFVDKGNTWIKINFGSAEAATHCAKRIIDEEAEVGG